MPDPLPPARSLLLSSSKQASFNGYAGCHGISGRLRAIPGGPQILSAVAATCEPITHNWCPMQVGHRIGCADQTDKNDHQNGQKTQSSGLQTASGCVLLEDSSATRRTHLGRMAQLVRVLP